MNFLIKHQFIIRHHLFLVFGILLCGYFCFHLVSGERSLLHMMSLHRELDTLSLKKDTLARERMVLQEKVARLRQETLDLDVLEERARAVLGYQYDGEFVILGNNLSKTPS